MVAPSEGFSRSQKVTIALRALSHKPAQGEHNVEHNLEALPGPSAFVEPVEVSPKEVEASLDIVREVAIRTPTVAFPSPVGEDLYSEA